MSRPSTRTHLARGQQAEVERPGRDEEGALQAEGSFPAGRSLDSSVAKKFYFAITKK